jgi:hypothetical protein
VVKLKDAIIGIGFSGLALILTGVHRVALHAGQIIVGIVVSLVKDA